MRNLHRLAVAAMVLTMPACATFQPATRGMGGAPESFVRLTTESQSSHTIGVPEGTTNPAAWRVLTGYLADRYTIAVRDEEAGFVMTAWEATLSREGVPDLRYRTRLTFSFLGDDWTQLHIRAEANWREGEQWQVGYDRQLLDRVATELKAKFAR